MADQSNAASNNATAERSNPDGLPVAGAGAQPAGLPIPKGPDVGARGDTGAVRSLAEKAGGNLVRMGNVWSYPGAPMDKSGTNLRLPVEYVSDAEVQAALADGTFHPVMGDGSAVRLKVEGGPAPMAMSLAMAGTPEAGTELPVGSRPSHDAGMRVLSPQEAIEESRKLQEAALDTRAENAAAVAAVAAKTAADARAASSKSKG